ncbi:MAG: extracellular solute-binding protein [Alphaproteobacteria bacterium]|nr:extracellular solute-binding protein [Alphaproteobacteria bacterium]
MSYRKLLDDLRHGRADRRTLNRALAALGLTTAFTPVGARAEAGQMPIYLTWSGYEIPELHPPFVAKYGRQVDYSNFADTTEAFQKIRAGYRPDLAHPCTTEMRVWTDAGILLPIDTGRLANWESLFPSLRSQNGVAFGGETYFVPTDWGNSSVIYRTDLVDAEESWAMLFDERYAGKISPYDTYENIQAAAAVLGIDPMNIPDDALYGPIADLLRKQRKITRDYWSTATELDQMLASGEVVIAYAWNETYKRLKEQGVPVAYARPKEGIWGWCCGLVCVKDGEGDDQMTYDFIDAWLSPEAGKYLIEEFGYGHANKIAFEIADPAIVENLGLTDPEALMAGSVFFGSYDPVSNEKFNLLWEEIKAGS